MKTTPCPEGCIGYFYDLTPVRSHDGELRLIGSCPDCGTKKIMDIPAHHYRRNTIIGKMIGFIYNTNWVLALILMAWLFAVAYSFTKPYL